MTVDDLIASGAVAQHVNRDGQIDMIFVTRKLTPEEQQCWAEFNRKIRNDMLHLTVDKNALEPGSHS